MGLDIGEPEGEGEADQRRCQRKHAAAQQGQQGQCAVAHDSDHGYWHVMNFGVSAVIDDAAIPVVVDAAGFKGLAAVYLECQYGDYQSGQCEQCNYVSQLTSLLRLMAAV